MTGLSTYIRGKYVWIRLSPNAARRLELPEQFSTKLKPEQADELQRLFKALERRQQASEVAPVSQIVFNGDAPNNLTWHEAFAKFTEQHKGTVTAKTMEGYKLAYRSIIQLRNYDTHAIHERWYDTDSDSYCLTAEKLIENFVRDGSVTAATRNIYYRSFRRFVAWLLEERKLQGEIRFARLRRLIPPAPGKVKQIYTNDEIQQFINYNHSLKKDHRTEFAYFIQLLGDSPLRYHEPFEIKHKDFGERYLQVLSKDGKRWERIPITETLRDVQTKLRALAPEREKLLRWNSAGNMRHRMSEWLKETAEACNIDLHGRKWHEFKKTYITRIMERVGKDLTIADAVTLSRCSLSVLQKHYWFLDQHRGIFLPESSLQKL